MNYAKRFQVRKSPTILLLHWRVKSRFWICSATKIEFLLIHNMGQACRYCTLWADGFNGFLPHLESVMSIFLVSRDAPNLQRAFAGSRNWGYRLASHGAGDYASEQTVMEGEANMPGAVVYQRDGDSITRKNSAIFGPGDLYCSAWNWQA